jgi:hypothetical protein
MDTVLIVVAVLFVMIIAGSMIAGGIWVYIDSRKRQRLTADAMNSLAKECTALSESLTEIAKVPGYLDGLVKVCGDQVIQVTEMKVLVEKFRLSLFGPDKTKLEEERAGFQAYDDRQADESFEIQQMVENGFSVEEAREKVKGARTTGRFRLG